ncbi:MAG: glycosyltransferase family 4 protein [Methanomicrobiales archaeon]
MKIGIITEYFPKTDDLEVKGGAEAAAFNEAYYLSKKHDITVITSKEDNSKPYDKIGEINIIRCGRNRSYAHSGSFLDRLSFMKSAYISGKNLNFDIVTAYNFITYPVAWKLSQKLKIPCVSRYHDVWIGEWVKNVGLKGITGEILERYTLSRDFDQIIAVSNFTKDKLKKYVPPEKLKVVPNIVELPTPHIEKFSNPTICCVSRLVKYKRVDDLIKALFIVKKEIPDISCVIIGTGPQENQLKNLVKQLKLEDNISFYGFVESHQKVLETIKASDAFCLASTVEGFGIVIVEAMALGIPFLASKILPIIEASAGKGGLFFEPENYVELAGKIKLLITNDQLKERLSQEGIQYSKRYKGERIALELEKIYENLIN